MHRKFANWFWSGLILLILMARWTYGVALPNAFVSDDIPNLYGTFNAARQGTLLETTLNKFTSSFSIGGYFYRPMIAVFHALDYIIWGTNPFGWHLTNILLHLICMGLLVVLIYQLGRRQSIAYNA